MRRVAFVILLAGLFLIPAQSASAETDDGSDYYIRDFHVSVVANPDRSYDVVETIDVWFNSPSHGIDRKIPTWSWLEKFTISDFQAVGDPYVLVSDNDLRTGDGDAMFTGQKTYTIKYTLSYFADDTPDSDSFFLNLVDTEWGVRIDNFSARVTLPESAVVEDYTLTGGEYGGDGAALADVSVSGNVIIIKGKQGLKKWDGVALNVKLPEGTFSAAGGWVPPLEATRLAIDVNIDKYGVMSVEERYTAKVNKALVFDRALSDFKGIGDQVKKDKAIAYYVSDGQGGFTKQVQPYTVTPYKVESIKIIDPGGHETAGASALDLSGYVGRTVDFSINYTLQNRLRESMGDVGFYLQLMKGYYTEMRVDRLDLSINAPFDILRIYGGGGGAQHAILGEPTTRGNRLSAQSIEPFDNQDVSYVVEFKDAGFVRKPNTVDIALPLALLAAALIVLFFALFHKKEKTIVPVIGFYPPKGMNPAEVGYVIDERVTGRDITSLIYYWASHGHLNIEIVSDKKYVLHWLSGLDDGHADYEHYMFSALWKFGAKRRSVTSDELKDNFYSVVKSTAGFVKKSFSGERALYRKGRSPIVATSFFLMCVGLVAFIIMGQFVDFVAGVYPMRPLFNISGRFGEYEDDFYLMFIFVLFSLLITMFLATNFYRSDRVLKSAAGVIRRIACLALSVGGAAMFTIVCGDGKILLTISALVSAASLYVIVNALPFIARLSGFGVHARGLCLGFKMFLMAAEKPRLEMLLKENPDYYYNILAYAQVLGVSKIWQRKFDRLAESPSSWLYGAGVDPAAYGRINAMNNRMYKRGRRPGKRHK